MRFIATALVWTLVLLLALDNLGVDITALVAGLGIGGVAAARDAEESSKESLIR